MEEKKISLLDDRGVVQNIKTQGSDRHIGPDRLKGVGWYHQAFQQLGVPKDRRNLFEIPKEGPIDLLIGQNSASLLTKPVRAQDHWFTPSCLSPKLVILKSPLNPKLLLSGELGIIPALFDQNYPNFQLSKAEYSFLNNLVQGEETMHRINSSTSKSLRSVARSDHNNPANVNINVMATAIIECGNLNSKVQELSNVDISKAKAVNVEAAKICQQDISNWPGSEVNINYRDKLLICKVRS